MVNREELLILTQLDHAVRSGSTRKKIEEIMARVEEKLARSPDDVLAWEPVPLELYDSPLPEGIRSSWVFVLSAGTATGAERHPNSHQRMMSYRGAGDFQTRTEGPWESHLLTSNRSARVENRWISIPPNVWHQGVVPPENWIVVSFHTAAEADLIEERPPAGEGEATRQRKYSALDRRHATGNVEQD